MTPRDLLPPYARSYTRTQFDTSAMPMLVIRIPPVLTAETIESLYFDWAGIAHACGRHVAVVDTTALRASVEGTRVRYDIARQSSLHRAIFERTLVVEVRIAPDPVVRATLASFDWRARAPWPTKNVRSAAAAEEWVRAHVSELRTR